ncbi:MAG TPA: ribbon-helix-helix protein, CopG family [Thermoanaerobaculia bacterium]|nr:ribbon-helix-helix protein, CopG family [Thermoanaerobaculia bacterium]
MPRHDNAKKFMPEKRSSPEQSIPVVRTTVNLTPDAIEAVRQMAKERGTTVADVIRRAIWIEKYLHETLKAGGKVLLEDSHGVRELVIR